MFERQLVERARSRELLNAGRRIPDNMPMMPMTTSSSTSVNAPSCLCEKVEKQKTLSRDFRKRETSEKIISNSFLIPRRREFRKKYSGRLSGLRFILCPRLPDFRQWFIAGHRPRLQRRVRGGFAPPFLLAPNGHPKTSQISVYGDIK